MVDTPQVVVAGHICLDVIPTFEARSKPMDEWLVPGTLINVGPVVTAPGGAVSNTGLALHRLGIPVRLMGKVGDDLFGDALLDTLHSCDESLTDGTIVSPGGSTSYTVVLSPPGVDRIFFHCPGANDTFAVDDVDLTAIAEAKLFHFGYPPIMRRMFEDTGAELTTLMQRVKAAGVTTSLDMAYPDPDSDAGRVDWGALLERVLPHVDVFVPSLDEILFMLDRPRFEALQGRTGGELAEYVEGTLLTETAERLLDLGVAIVGLKLGSQGLYVRTTTSAARLEDLGAAPLQAPGSWRGRELLAPCFDVEVAGATGAGDCTVAGFLAGLLRGCDPAATMTTAVAVGAFSVEHPDATSGVPDWAAVQERVATGWPRHTTAVTLDGWTWDAEDALWSGPNDYRR